MGAVTGVGKEQGGFVLRGRFASFKREQQPGGWMASNQGFIASFRREWRRKAEPFKNILNLYGGD